MVVRKCEYQDCAWSLETDDLVTYVELLKIHVNANHATAPNNSSKPEKAKRPELGSDVSDEDWSYFISRWKEYKKATNLQGDEEIVSQLMECCTEQLRRDHHRTYLTAEQTNAATEDTRLDEIKKIAVSKKNVTVNRVKLGTMKQDRGEAVRKFAGRVRSLAAVSGYSVKCSRAGCNTEVSYTNQVITDTIIKGLADTEIQRDVLSHVDADKCALDTFLV